MKTRRRFSIGELVKVNAKKGTESIKTLSPLYTNIEKINDVYMYRPQNINLNIGKIEKTGKKVTWNNIKKPYYFVRFPNGIGEFFEEELIEPTFEELEEYNLNLIVDKL